MPIESQSRQRSESELQWSPPLGVTFIADEPAIISAEEEQMTADTKLDPQPLAWRYCALSMLGVSALCYGAIYAIAAIL
jgi:hypothetical protein